MRILVLGFTKLKFMPYINFYLSNINADKNDAHVVYWNRDCKHEDISDYSGVTLHEFVCYQEDDVSKLKKVTSFLKYRTFVKSVIKNFDFDKIIVLHTLPGIIMYDLLRKFKNNFVLDYRDSTYEYLSPFRKLVGNMVKWSEATFVSSDSFRKYLPLKYKEKIYTSHNILQDSLSHQEDREKYGIASNKIRVAFWGFIRHEEVNKKIISKLSNDSRFELHYYGREQQVAENLKQFAKDLNSSNVFFHGEYRPYDRYEFIKVTDCIHNIYYDNNMMNAMGNKYYDGIIFRIPQICMLGSYMGMRCHESGVGIALTPDNISFADDLYDYLHNLDVNDFKLNCMKELQHVLSEYEQGKMILKWIFENNHEC